MKACAVQNLQSVRLPPARTCRQDTCRHPRRLPLPCALCLHQWPCRMSSSRRPVFEYALRLAQSLEQQQRELDGNAHQADGPDGGSQPGSPTAAAGAEDFDDYVKVEFNDAAGDVASSPISIVPRKQVLREALVSDFAALVSASVPLPASSWLSCGELLDAEA